MSPRTTVAAQISALTSQLQPISSSSSNSTIQPSNRLQEASSSKMAQTRPPVTCHVLDTTIGLPAAGITVVLVVYDSEVDVATDKSIWRFQGVTNSDGRVTHWPAGRDASESLDMLTRIFEQKSHAQDLHCTLEFKTGPYWEQKGTKPFFPSVKIQFITTGYQDIPEGTAKPHWHVPLLLGPYNYTTYRGS